MKDYSSRARDYAQMIMCELERRGIDFEMYPWHDELKDEPNKYYDKKESVFDVLREIDNILLIGPDPTFGKTKKLFDPDSEEGREYLRHMYEDDACINNIPWGG